MGATRKLHSQALRIVKAEERMYSRMVLREYTRLFNKWRTAANQLFEVPDELNDVVADLMTEHSAKLSEIMRTNNARVMSAVHKFQMNFLGIKETDTQYTSTRSMIPGLSTAQARTAVAETSSRTQTILQTANNMASEDDSPKNAIAYANERLAGGMGTRRANTIGGDQAHRAANTMIQAIGEKFQSTGLKAWKMWMARKDNKVRQAHREADGQVVQANETYTVGGESLRFPGDPNGSAGNVINCRCVSIVKRRPGKSTRKVAA